MTTVTSEAPGTYAHWICEDLRNNSEYWIATKEPGKITYESSKEMSIICSSCKWYLYHKLRGSCLNMTMVQE